MATLASSALTLAEWATRLDPGGKPAAVIELLGQTNEMLTDMLWMECNDGAGHKTTVRTGLPSVTWRLLNYGVQPSKSTTAPAGGLAPSVGLFRITLRSVPTFWLSAPVIVISPSLIVAFTPSLPVNTVAPS